MEHRPASRWARTYLTLAVLLALAPAVVIVLGAVGTKLGLWSWKLGFGAVMVRGPFGIGWAPALAMLAIAAAVIGVIVSIRAGLWRRSLAALIISLATMGAFIYMGGQAKKAPPIHDVATDWREPLMFSDAVMKARGPEANPVEANPTAPDGKPISDVNEQTCAGAKPVLLAKPQADAYAAAKAAVTAAGLDIVTDQPELGLIEAVATSFWYGFKDDLMVRVQPDGSGSRIDIRSVSRVGMSDLGANCKRVSAIAAAIKG
jgi:fatty-acyl-CoA synthase